MNKKTGVRQQEILHHSKYCLVVNIIHAWQRYIVWTYFVKRESLTKGICTNWKQRQITEHYSQSGQIIFRQSQKEERAESAS